MRFFLSTPFDPPRAQIVHSLFMAIWIQKYELIAASIRHIAWTTLFARQGSEFAAIGVWVSCRMLRMKHC